MVVPDQTTKKIFAHPSDLRAYSRRAKEGDGVVRVTLMVTSLDLFKNAAKSDLRLSKRSRLSIH